MAGLDCQVLILGAGWTATFLIPLLQQRDISFAATTTDGRTLANGVPTIAFRYDPDAPDQVAALPRAKTVLVTFPLRGAGASRVLVDTYAASHQSGAAALSATGPASAPTPTPTLTPTPTSANPHPHPYASSSHFRFIQLGSTGIRQGKQGQTGSGSDHWLTRHSPYDDSNPRVIAEDELLQIGGCVLNLAGLWGGQRDPRNWVERVAKTKDDVRGKKSLHLIHGVDVARAIAAVAGCEESTWGEQGRGQRWMLTDSFVYDWWALLASWADLGEGKEAGETQPIEQARWVLELMAEGEGVRALPRSMEALGRCYDSREFWTTFGLVPLKGGV